MSLPAFIASVLAEGRAAAPPPGVASADDLARVRVVLADFESSWRLEVPGTAPPFHAEVAVWASTQFYRACQFAVFRDEGPDFGFEPLADARELTALPAAHYSADLTFRFLPDLIKQVRAIATDDPLAVELLRWAERWPLSSVGVEGLEMQAVDAALSAIVADECLLRLYVDRVIERRDHARLQHPAIRQAVAAALGVHDELAPHLAKSLRQPEEAAP